MCSVNLHNFFCYRIGFCLLYHIFYILYQSFERERERERTNDWIQIELQATKAGGQQHKKCYKIFLQLQFFLPRSNSDISFYNTFESIHFLCFKGPTKLTLMPLFQLTFLRR